MQPGMQRCIKISAGDDFFLKRIGWATDCFQLLLFDKAYCGGSCHELFFFFEFECTVLHAIQYIRKPRVHYLINMSRSVKMYLI